MINSVTEIEKLISKKNASGENTFANIVYNLMTNLNQSYSDIMAMPLPLVFELLNILDKENKKMEKEMKKGRKR